MCCTCVLTGRATEFAEDVTYAPIAEMIRRQLGVSADTPPSEVLAQWKSEFDAIYDQERFLVLCVHPRSGWGSGTPARTWLMEQFIMYMKQHDGVRFFSSAQFAQWCLDHPAALEEVTVP